MKILLAPDKFKGTCDAGRVAAETAKRLARLRPDWTYDLCPVADGGEGTLESLAAAGTAMETILGIDLQGRLRPLSYALIARKDKPFLVLEAASCISLAGLPIQARKPESLSSYPLGFLLKDVLKKHPGVPIAIGLGGTATVDGGMGFLQALGARFESSDDRFGELPIGGALSSVAKADLAPVLRRLDGIPLEGWCDVRSPLLGPTGAARMYGPQKGADPDAVLRLEAGLELFAGILEKTSGRRLKERAGTGAAGGLGLAVVALGGNLRSGFEALSENIHLEDRIRTADAVVTGEGRLDVSTRQGKAPWGVKCLAEKLGKPCYALAGSATDAGEGWAGIVTLFDNPVDTDDPRLGDMGNRLDVACARLVTAIESHKA